MIAIICGKSASGKDTLLKELKKDGIGTIVSTTSRPAREGEKDGREYDFISKEDFISKIENGGFLEYRSYNTLVDGKADIWYYGIPKETVDKLDPDMDYAVILDLQGTKAFLDYYGSENCFVCYMEASEEVRRKRAESRGSFDKTEWDRRAIDDDISFAKKIRDTCVDITIVNENREIEDIKEEFYVYLGYHKELKEAVSSLSAPEEDIDR